ncbi:hypothetical protein PVAP13_7KG048236 [Panicum virgatum]|uniref:Uncharacterized protein n=1 Tax=Panicum virgatum TaxID=38727 RepID=A0A8T0Q6E7_PANVG|nr:hypothetical protein PVAP13_7KG048236 [Panicum virgatum]
MRPSRSKPTMHACTLSRLLANSMHLTQAVRSHMHFLAVLSPVHGSKKSMSRVKDDERDRKLAILVVATQGRLAIQQDQVNAMYRRPCGAHPKDSQTQQVSTSHSVCSSCIHAHDTIPLLRKKREKYNSNI